MLQDIKLQAVNAVCKLQWFLLGLIKQTSNYMLQDIKLLAVNAECKLQ